MIHIFEIPDTNLSLFQLITFNAHRQRLSCYWRNSVYPIVKATKFTVHA